jgi:peptidoglycan/xylan/chitin deacetylase (PgdA/CDA1 family)
MDELRDSPARVAGEEEGVAKTFQVLLYHGVLIHQREIRGKPVREYLSRDQFLSQVRWMKERDSTFLTLQECRERSMRGDLPARTICLTFDDGKKSHLDLVAPVLQEAGVRGTFFIITEWLGRPNFLKPPDLKRLSDMGMEIGSHSVSHPFMTTLSDEALWREAKESKEYLENLIARPVESFSYPYGDVNDKVREAVARGGYTVGCGAWRGSNTSEADWLVLNRWGIHDTTGLQGLKRIVEEGTPSLLERGADFLKRSVGMRPYVRWRERFLKKAGE